jgi:hypothetical protein
MNDAPATGIQVVATGRNLMGTRTVATDADGFFQLRLPPGDYSQRLTRLGMRPIDIGIVKVALGRTTAVATHRLAERPVELEAVRVSARTRALDPVHTDIGATLTAADYAQLPLSRDYRSVMELLPHIVQSSRGDPLNVSGATGLENVFFIDGVNVTDPLKGEGGTSLPSNFVRAVEVKTGGYDAEFGKALGAVVNAVTYSGTNEFEVDVFAFGTTDALSASPRSEPRLRVKSSREYDVGVR